MKGLKEMDVFTKTYLLGMLILLNFDAECFVKEVPHQHCQLVYFHGSVNWYMAQVMCISGDGDFVNELAGAVDVLPEDGTLAWTSLMADFSYFVEYKGCFSTKVGSDFKIHKRTKLGDDARVSKCLSICKGEGRSTFSLTAPDVCDCMSAVLPSFRMNSVSRCNVTCPGDVRDMCGGDSVMSVYRTSYMMGEEITTTSPDVECYAVMKYQDMLDTMAGHCLDAKSGYVCKICDGNLSNCTSEVVNEISNWYDARDACSRRNGVLDSDRGLVQSYRGDGAFWLGFQRWVVWKDEKDIDDPSNLCVACGKSNRKLNCSNLRCTERHAYLCMKAKLPPMTNITSTESAVSNYTTEYVLESSISTNITANVNTTDSGVASFTSTTNYVSTTMLKENSSSSSSEISSLPTKMISVKSSHTSKVQTITDVQPIGSRRQPETYGSSIGTWLLVLGIIAGMLFVFSIAFLVLLSYRRSRKKRSFLLPEENVLNNVDPFVHLKRQRSFSNPGFHETGDNGDVFLQFASTENTRTCDDCSTFTLAKKKTEEITTESNTSISALDLKKSSEKVNNAVDEQKIGHGSEIENSEITNIHQKTDLTKVSDDKDTVSASMLPKMDSDREINAIGEDTMLPSVNTTKNEHADAGPSSINTQDTGNDKNEDHVTGSDPELKPPPDPVDNGYDADSEDTSAILSNQ